MVLVPNTIANPWTVVVHLHHAFAAEATVMSSWRFDHLAVFAPPEYHEIPESVVMLTSILRSNGGIDSLLPLAAFGVCRCFLGTCGASPHHLRCLNIFVNWHQLNFTCILRIFWVVQLILICVSRFSVVFNIVLDFRSWW